LSLAISSNYMLFSNESTPTPNGVNLGIQPVLPDAKHVLILNNAVNTCTQEDMEVRCRMLFSKTNKRLLFVTQTLNYYIPVDSLNVFRDAAAISFTNNVTDDIIVALYLKMNDAVTGQPGNTLLVKQINGSWLTLADISFANFNNSGNYTASTFHKFNNLYKNIPKPLVICAQVAKVNGLLTTIYINKGQAIKGREQIYYHSFRLDKAFDELKQLDDQLRALNQQYSGTGSPAMGTGNASPQLMLQIDEVVNRMKRVYARAASEPQFREADQHFKEVYLQSRAAVQAGALKYIQDRYGLLYHNSQFSTLIAETGLPSDLFAGSCRSSEQSDVIADVLMFTSLLLAPTGLDFIPDALSVAYFASQDNTLEFLQASASLVLPSNIKALKKAANSVKTAFDEVHLGNVLTWDNGVVKGIQQDNNLMSAVFNINLDNTDVTFINKINANPQALKELMHLPEQKGTLYSNVSRKINESKRREFVQKAIDEPGWRQKVIDDPDEVLKWAGVKLGTKIDDHVTVTQKNNDLPGWLVASFKESQYLTVKNDVVLTLYRSFGDQAFLDGSFSTTIHNATRDELALHSSFNNSMRFRSTIAVPEGTTLNIGKVGPYPPNGPNSLPGGADQIVLPENYDYSWIKEVYDSETGLVYTAEEFKTLFPNLVKSKS
jgi:hypothetical protein